MSKEAKLVVQTREASGTSGSRRLRREGWLPGVVNGAKGRSSMVKLSSHNFEMMLHHHASENLIFDLQIDEEKPRKVLLKEVQHDPLTGYVLHVDFLEISMTKKMRVNILLTLVGEAAGVHEGGVLEHLMREIEVDCLPADLVEEIEVDVSALNIGDTLLVRDLKVDEKLAVLTAGDIAVVSVAHPRVEEEVAVEEEAAVEGAEGAEPDIIREKGKEEAEGESAESAGKEK